MCCAGLSHARATGSLDERDGPLTPADPMAWGPEPAQRRRFRGRRARQPANRRRVVAARPPRRAEAPGPVGPGNDRVRVGLSHARPVSPGLEPVGLPDKVTAARGRLRPRACVSRCVCVWGGARQGTAAFGVEGKEGGKAPGGEGRRQHCLVQ